MLLVQKITILVQCFFQLAGNGLAMNSSGIGTINYQMRTNLNRIINLTVSTATAIFYSRCYKPLILKTMNLKDFKLVKNRQRPDFCYSYEKKEPSRKYSIFTMNGGKTFLASIEEPRMYKKWYSEFLETHDSVEKCLTAFDGFWPSYGGGLRVQVDSKNKINLRLDMGFGRNGIHGTYISFSEAFWF